MTYDNVHTQLLHSLPVESIPNSTKGLRNILNQKSNALSLGPAVLSVLLSSIPIPCLAALYNITQIPAPNITIPAGTTARPVCLSINASGVVACNLEIFQTQTPTPIDRFSPTVKILASYAYTWNSVTKALTLLSSPVTATTFDRANVITDTGFVGGSTGIFNKPSTGAIWSVGLTKPSLFGPGAITDMNNIGDYVLNKQLFVNNQAVSFAGKNVQVHAINNVSPVTNEPRAAGRQDLDTPIKISGMGLQYSNALLNPVPSNPVYALTSSLSDYSVSGMSDTGNFVITGAPNTISAAVALSCTVSSQCNYYFTTVVTSGRVSPYLRLNSVDNARHVVGTDGGVALLINPPTSTALNGTRIDLNSLLPAGSFSTLGWFLNEAISINNNGLIVGVGLKSGKLVSYLLTPII